MVATEVNQPRLHGTTNGFTYIRIEDFGPQEHELEGICQELRAFFFRLSNTLQLVRRQFGQFLRKLFLFASNQFRRFDWMHLTILIWCLTGSCVARHGCLGFLLLLLLGSQGLAARIL